MFRIKTSCVRTSHVKFCVLGSQKDKQFTGLSDDDRLPDTRVKSSERVLFAHVYVDKIYYNVRVAYY